MQHYSIIKHRILEFIDYKGITKYRFYKNSGITRGVLEKKGGISEDNIAKFIACFPEVCETWILTGTGPMLKQGYDDSPQQPHDISERPAVYNPEQQRGIPLITMEDIARWGEGDGLQTKGETTSYVVAEFHSSGADFMVEISGDAMHPEYRSGDRVACKKLPLDTFFQWNKVYVLTTVQGGMIKRVRESSLQNHIKCVSDNPEYQTIDLNLDAVHALAIVLGIIRFIA